MSEAIHFVPPFVFFVLTNRSNTVWRPNMKSWSYYCHSFFLTMWRKMERCSQGCCRGLYLLVLCVDDPNNKPHDDQIWEEIFILLPFIFWQCDEKSIGLYSPRVLIVVLLFVCIGPFLLISLESILTARTIRLLYKPYNATDCPSQPNCAQKMIWWWVKRTTRYSSLPCNRDIWWTVTLNTMNKSVFGL